MDELMGDFIAETREMLDAIAGEIVAWEANPGDRARLDSIFRFVHTVKGSCGFLDLPRLARLSHAAEDALADVRAGRRLPDPALVGAVLAILDRIRELAQAIESGESLDHAEDERLIAALDARLAADPPPVAVAAAPRGQPRTIRLPVELLDSIMSGVSDVVLARNELALLLRGACRDREVAEALDRLTATIGEMREAVTRTRMQRIDHLFAGLPRMVRDLSRELGRSVLLELDGGDVELDREMIEMIRDPIAHIVRNAIDHGIESADDRRAVGKPATGSLRIAARQSGNRILIDIADDGRGMDGDRIVARAVEAGVVSAEEAAALPDDAKLALVFEPGLSTAPAVTAISGRGVGMDVVRANVQRIGGTVELESRPGQGTRIVLRVPLTLTIIPALIVEAGGERFAIPRLAIEEIVRVAPGGARIEARGGERIAVARGRRMPLVDLAGVLGLDSAGAAPTLVLLRPVNGEVFAVAVAEVHSHEELVVKPAAPAVMAIGLYAGTSLLDSGRPMLLLDCAGIAEASGIAGAPAVAVPPPERTSGPPAEPLLLFRDLDGAERAVPVALVERIEEIRSDAVHIRSGRPCLAPDGVPLLPAAPVHGRDRLRVLRMGEGDDALAYAIDEVIDVLPFGRAGADGDARGTPDGDPAAMLDMETLRGMAGAAGFLPPLAGRR